MESVKNVLIRTKGLIESIKNLRRPTNQAELQSYELVVKQRFAKIRNLVLALKVRVVPQVWHLKYLVGNDPYEATLVCDEDDLKLLLELANCNVGAEIKILEKVRIPTYIRKSPNYKSSNKD
jgi:hypothetical protein